VGSPSPRVIFNVTRYEIGLKYRPTVRKRNFDITFFRPIFTVFPISCWKFDGEKMNGIVLLENEGN